MSDHHHPTGHPDPSPSRIPGPARRLPPVPGTGPVSQAPVTVPPTVGRAPVSRTLDVPPAGVSPAGIPPVDGPSAGVPLVAAPSAGSRPVVAPVRGAPVGREGGRRSERGQATAEYALVMLAAAALAGLLLAWAASTDGIGQLFDSVLQSLLGRVV